MATKNYIYPKYEKRIKLTNELIRYLNVCISLQLYIQLNRDSLILAKDDNALDYFVHHKKKKYPLSNKK